jgi:hypothetical protein
VDAWSAVIHQGYGGPRSAITATYAGFDIDLAVFGNHIFDQMRDRASTLLGASAVIPPRSEDVHR